MPGNTGADGRLTQLYDGVQHVDYGCNSVNHLTAMSDSGNPAATQTIDYDAVDRVGNVYRSGDQQGFAWDQADNRLVHARQGASYSLTPDSQSNRLTRYHRHTRAQRLAKEESNAC